MKLLCITDASVRNGVKNERYTNPQVGVSIRLRQGEEMWVDQGKDGGASTTKMGQDWHRL